WPWSQVRADVEADGERRARVVQAARDIDAHRADRRAPAHADADAGVQVRILAVEGAARVDEDCSAPAFIEVLLELKVGGHHVLRAQPQVADARPDLAVTVAADAAVAAGIEAQAGRQVEHRAGEGVAEFAAHDQAAALAQ